MANIKHCNQCGMDKPTTDFTPRKQSWDGLRAECRLCRNKRQRVDDEKNREEVRRYRREYMRRRRAANPGMAAAEAAKWRKAHPEKVVDVNKRFYWNHRDKSLEKSSRWGKENPQRRRELAKEWRQKNPEKAKANARASQIRNKDAVNQRNRNRRAAKAAAGGKHSAADVKSLLILPKHRCAHPWCRASLKEKYHVDHVIALARGGSNDKKNLQLLCPPCNIKKHAKHPIDVARENGMLL